MPVLPLVESSRIFPGASLPVARASATMRAAARSLTDPPGLYHSALPKRWTLGSCALAGCASERSRMSASSGSRGVLPMPASRASPRRFEVRLDAASAWEGHGGGAEPEADDVIAWDAPVTTVMCPQS